MSPALPAHFHFHTFTHELPLPGIVSFPLALSKLPHSGPPLGQASGRIDYPPSARIRLEPGNSMLLTALAPLSSLLKLTKHLGMHSVLLASQLSSVGSMGILIPIYRVRKQRGTQGSAHLPPAPESTSPSAVVHRSARSPPSGFTPVRASLHFAELPMGSAPVWTRPELSPPQASCHFEAAIKAGTVPFAVTKSVTPYSDVR